MPSCERCWHDSHSPDEHHDQVAEYHRLIAERDCTPEQQAGLDAEMCPTCGRQTVHEHAHVCVVCGASS